MRSLLEKVGGEGGEGWREREDQQFSLVHAECRVQRARESQVHTRNVELDVWVCVSKGSELGLQFGERLEHQN